MIEKGTKDDIKELGELYDQLNDYLASHINYPGWIKGVYPIEEDAKVAIAEGTLYVLRLNQKIVGSIILRHKPETVYEKVDWKIDLDYADIFVVYTLVVHPDYLKQGIGKKLIEFVIEESYNNNIKAIRLDVYEKNIPAIQLYQQYGFEYIDKVDLGYSQYGLDYFDLYQKIL